MASRVVWTLSIIQTTCGEPSGMGTVYHSDNVLRAVWYGHCLSFRQRVASHLVWTLSIIQTMCGEPSGMDTVYHVPATLSSCTEHIVSVSVYQSFRTKCIVSVSLTALIYRRPMWSHQKVCNVYKYNVKYYLGWSTTCLT